ncbi:cholesterol oxidase [Rhodococcus sp. OK519]|nr:cholesterol oxidase [Rhodococcus sp. OK519]
MLPTTAFQLGGFAVSEIKRRSFLTAAAASAVGIALAAPGAARAAGIAARVDRIPLTREDHRVIVIGSGFGGGVTALRLAEAGVPVLVLERGMRWPTGPVVVEPYTGLVEAVPGDNITALCAAGVGGGSLIYQGMSLQPSEAVFTTHFPGGIDWAEMDRVHYRRVARMLGLAVAPDELVDTPSYLAPRIFAQNIERAGLPLSKIPMPIDWNYALDELRGLMKPSYTNGDGALGVNNGGKHSVDVTYIAAAEATGNVTVRTLHEVTDVERAPDGRWTVYVNRIDTSGRVLENKILTTNALVMAAGSVNTTKMLVRAAAQDRIPDMPDALGGGWGTNADRIYVWTDPTREFGVTQGGPVVYGSLNWDDPRSAHTVIQASIPSLSVDVRSTMLVGYGVSEGRGSFVYDPASSDAVLRWPREGDWVIQNGHIGPTVRAIAGPTGILTDTTAIAPSTWHPLGGANMGAVCDLEGRVHGQRGLYVLDGALMPGNTAACNPSMTIAAIAERALDRVVARDVGDVI